ncbi:DUF378 domain-containing protein [Thalassobacillus pellis]|uniref:DUF378 domain-containing protein n=1 Tax=Thalassobacillus pellis TaxID=748008 RepID=UPI00196101A5|nr:DUF378 domain-containing protein [Thalassobacillus pellis]MBM7554858.1 uncharacterized membrane protein YuzA (DUF378 family) [Thalassobacillus pellis]
MNVIQRIALILVIIGAVNWGLVGLFQYDLVAGLFGGGEQSGAFARIIYSLVGISGIIAISLLFKPDEELADNSEPSTTK